MRFMVMHKMTAELEKGLPPDQAVIHGVGKLIQQAVEQKSFVAGEGLRPSRERLRLSYENGKRTVTDGPFAEAKELVAGFALMRVKSKADLLAWSDRFAEAHGDATMIVGPVVEPWDLGMSPKPADAPLRFLSILQSDEVSESDAPPDPQVMARMGALIQEMTKAGVMESTGGLWSTKRGARVRFDAGKHTVVDGPFAESKELIAGYAILDLPSKAAAIEWAIRFGHVVKVDEVEVREVCV